MSGSHVDDDFLDSDVDLTQSRSVRLARATERPAPYLMLVLERHRLLAAGARYPLVNIDEVVVGRGRVRAATRERDGERRRLTIRVPDPQASTTHARILRSDGGWTVEDAQSKNGTVVNGEPATVTRLGDGDVIEIGQTFFMFRDAVPSAVGDAIDLDAAQLEPQAPGLGTLVPPLARRFDALAQVARASVAVLVRGETGTGKELVARAVHALSGRRGDFVPVNCGALPDTLVETELFGYRKGAFSGALEDRKGLVRSADGGTLFLDEIGDLELTSQAALLRVLQEREVTPVGATKAVAVDVQLCAATHQDLDAMVETGKFRPDLLGRVAGWTLTLPPLRERIEDMGLLLAALLERQLPERADSVTLSAEAARALLDYSWPLNIRELGKTLVAAVALSGGAIELEHLPDDLRRGLGLTDASAAPVAPGAPLTSGDERLRTDLLALCTEHQGNVSAVARAMGKERVQIRRWAKRFGINLDSFRK